MYVGAPASEKTQRHIPFILLDTNMDGIKAFVIQKTSEYQCKQRKNSTKAY